MKIILTAVLTILTSVHSLYSYAEYDACANVDKTSEYANYVFGVSDGDQRKLADFGNLYCGLKLKDQVHLNTALAALEERSNGLAFLQDIDFKFKTFQADGEDTSLGFSYDYNKTNPMGEYHYSTKKNLTTGSAWVFSAKGNVAFDADQNPADFLDTRFSISGFRDYGGVSTARIVSQNLATQITVLDDAALDLTGVELEKNRLRVKQLMEPFFETQTYVGYDLNAGLESDQNFDSRQWSYGGRVVLDVKGYGRDNVIAKWNIFDYPFAALRLLTGFGETGSDFHPLGSSFPTFLVGLDQVDPSDNELRQQLGETNRYERVKAEAYMRTPIAQIQGATVFANIDYRYWYELDAPDSVENANLDKLDYFTFSISSDMGIFVSYSKGKLPFDLEDQEVYEIGWKFHLN